MISQVPNFGTMLRELAVDELKKMAWDVAQMAQGAWLSTDKHTPPKAPATVGKGFQTPGDMRSAELSSGRTYGATNLCDFSDPEDVEEAPVDANVGVPETDL